jgi:predicted TIM-barrel fold metal-dependent hydrolase
MGWHVQVNIKGAELRETKATWSDLPCPVVFDHLAHVPEPNAIEHPAFAFVRELMQRNKAWVKLSGFYNDTKVGPPTYADSVAVARAFAKEAPERVVWGSDWPHPTEKENKPDDAILLDCFAEAVPDEAARHRILVDNPTKLYQFT